MPVANLRLRYWAEKIREVGDSPGPIVTVLEAMLHALDIEDNTIKEVTDYLDWLAVYEKDKGHAELLYDVANRIRLKQYKEPRAQ